MLRGIHCVKSEMIISLTIWREAAVSFQQSGQVQPIFILVIELTGSYCELRLQVRELEAKA